MENSDFLKKKYNLHNTPEIKLAKERTEKHTGEKVLNTPNDLIENYLNRFKEITERKDPESRKMGMQALKKVLLDKFITKFDEIPKSYWDLNDRIIRERGQSGDWNRYSEELKNRERKNQVEGVLIDQRASLEQWIDYLASDDSKYPDYLKYWIFRSVTELQEFDKEKKKYPKRSKGTVAMFPDINHEALSYAIDAVIKKHNNQEFRFEGFEADLTIEQKEEFKKFLNNENFADIYSWSNELIHPIPEHLLPITEGAWKKYEQDKNNSENYKELVASIRGRGTGWCTAGENTAKSQLSSGDFYCYYTLDDNKKPTIPRIAIRMDGKRIAEVRGISYKQNLDSYMGEVLEEKLNEFSDKKEYLKKDSDMKKLTEIDNKVKKGEEINKEELEFIYEINGEISGFGYSPDPRIEELKKDRNFESDLSFIFGCEKEQIAHDIEEINNNTKAYIGKWSPEILKKIPIDMVYLYESFPKKRIFKESIELTTKNHEQYIKNFKKDNVSVGAWVNSTLEKVKELKQREVLNIICVSVTQLGLQENATLEQIYDRARELNLKLCPPQVAPELALKLSLKKINSPGYFEILNEARLHIATEPIIAPFHFFDTDNKYPHLLHIEPRLNNNYVSIGTWHGQMDEKYYSFSKFVFSL